MIARQELPVGNIVRLAESLAAAPQSPVPPPDEGHNRHRSNGLRRRRLSETAGGSAAGRAAAGGIQPALVGATTLLPYPRRFMMPPPRTTDVSFTRTTTLPAIRMLVLGGFLMLAGGRPLAAQSATQMVTFRVLGRSRAAVTPIATPLAVHPTSATVANGTFALSTNEANQKIVASIDRKSVV